MAKKPGIWIEDKEHALTIHYRDVPRSEARRARLLLNGVIAPFQSNLRIHSGKNIWEVVPRELEDKGAAVREPDSNGAFAGSRRASIRR